MKTSKFPSSRGWLLDCCYKTQGWFPPSASPKVNRLTLSAHTNRKMIDSGKVNSAKLLRKQKRCQAILSRDDSVKCVDDPTKFIAICNAGLSTGLQKERVLEEALKHGRILDVVMLSNKSYCFLHCFDEKQSANIFEKMHGVAKLGQNGTVVYLSYVQELPQLPDSWKHTLPGGLIILENFVSADEEKILLEVIRSTDESIDQRVLKHRQVKHFGYEFIYGINNVDTEKPLERGIPSECQKLWTRLEENVPADLILGPDQLTVNIYEPGQGIPSHVDTHSAFLDPIYSLSLESDIVMEFRRGVNEHIPILIPRRSLLIMSGESRYAWTHGITPRQMDVVSSKEGGLTVQYRSRRTSFTFRALRRSRCDCSYPELCDTYAAEQKPETNRLSSIAAKLEEENVHKVYDAIASHFSETRHKPWPKVESFIKSFEQSSILLDVGCGNGKYLKVNSDIVEIGCDRSEGLLQVCLQRQCHVFQCNCLNLPFRDLCVDGCISIAVIHHLANETRRIRAIREMARVLIPGGRCLIYVWAKNQEFNSEKSSYLHRNQNNRLSSLKTEQIKESSESSTLPSSNSLKSDLVDLPVHTNRTQFQEQDVFVPWKLKSSQFVKDGNTRQMVEQKKEFLRYYHVFEEGELAKLCSSIDCIEVECSYYEQGNWCVIFKKK